MKNIGGTLPLGMPLDHRVRACADLLVRSIPDARGAPIMDLARSCNLSVSRLRHLFTASIGVPPGRYLRDLRMREAELLLKTTFLSIKESGWQVGIRDPSHFTRYFRHAYGVSPTCYRNAAWSAVPHAVVSAPSKLAKSR